MANRCLLHFNHLEPLKAWLDKRGIEHRPGVPPYQVLRLRVNGGWRAIYVTATATQHYTVPWDLSGLIGSFMRDLRQFREVENG